MQCRCVIYYVEKLKSLTVMIVLTAEVTEVTVLLLQSTRDASFNTSSVAKLALT